MKTKLSTVFEVIGISFIGLMIMLFMIVFAEMCGYIEIYPLETLTESEVLDDGYINQHPFHLWIIILIIIFYPSILVTAILSVYCLKSRYKNE